MSKYRDIMLTLEKNALKRRKTIIFPESSDERVIMAVREILKRKFACVMLIQRNDEIESMFKPVKDLTLVDAGFGVQYASQLRAIRRRKFPGFTSEQAEKETGDPLVFSLLLLKNGLADGVVAGSVYTTPDVIRNSISIIGLQKGNKTVSSFFLLSFPKDHPHAGRPLAFADSGVIPVPTVEQLADIAIQTSANFRKLTGLKPKVAFLSFSTKGSAKDESTERMVMALALCRKKNPNLIADGELQFDAAFVPSVAERKNREGQVKGDANVFVFPDLNSGNISYKIAERIGGASATGPILQGLQKPVMDLSRGCSAGDIVDMARVISNI